MNRIRFLLFAILISVLWLPQVSAEGDPAAGADVYKLNCAACHGATLEGGIAVSLKANPFVDGSDEAKLIDTVSNGRPDKGMPAWSEQLTSEQIQNIVALLKNPGAMPQASAVDAVEEFEPDISTEGVSPDMKRSFLFVYAWTLISMVVLLVWIKQKS